MSILKADAIGNITVKSLTMKQHPYTKRVNSKQQKPIFRDQT